MTDTGPVAEGNRRPWTDLPATVVAAVEDLLGARVVVAHDQRGGFSPGVAARLELDDGRRAFVKAITDEPMPDSPTFHRREAEITAALPEHAPTPRLLGWCEVDRWVALALEDVDGRQPALPWREDELRAVVAALDDLADVCTPCPVELDPAAVAYADDLIGWRSFADAPDRLAAADAWTRDHIEQLVGLEQRWPEVLAGETLLHGDLRADNLLLTAEGVVIVDWPWAAVGNPIIDLVGMLPSVAMQSDIDPETVLGWSRVAAGTSPDEIDVTIATVAGFFAWHAQLPPEPGVEKVRDFQRAQAETSIAWLRHRLART